MALRTRPKQLRWGRVVFALLLIAAIPFGVYFAFIHR
jgi:hypothetical protein